jgi:hypothetical protein
VDHSRTPPTGTPDRCRDRARPPIRALALLLVLWLALLLALPLALALALALAAVALALLVAPAAPASPLQLRLQLAVHAQPPQRWYTLSRPFFFKSSTEHTSRRTPNS